MAKPQRLQPAFPIGLHVVGEDRVDQQRNMAADIVENIGLLKVVELVAASDKACRRKAAAGEIGEEDIVGNEAGHRDEAPAGCRIEHVAQSAKVRDAVGGYPERAEPIEELVAGAIDEQSLLAFEKQPPNRMLFVGVVPPILYNRKIRIQLLPGPGHRLSPNVASSHVRLRHLSNVNNALVHQLKYQ